MIVVALNKPIVALEITFCNQRFECPFTNPEADVAKSTAPLTIHSIYKNIIQPKQLPHAMGNPINLKIAQLNSK